MTDNFPAPGRLPAPPIDRELIARTRERLRRQISDAPPASDPLTREIQDNIARGVRGRDLLGIDAYREHFAARSDEFTQRLQHAREELDEETRKGSGPER